MENQYTDQSTPNVPFDVVKLPSKGIFYPSKKSSLKVGYLNASDENILMSPNLVNSGELMDILLRHKILDKDIDTKLLLECDKQAVFIFLRNTSFGPEYEIILNDPGTNKEFSHIINLTSVPIRNFDLIPDSNGEFEFMLPTSNKLIKFKFLTTEDEIDIDKTVESYQTKGVKIIPRVTKRLEKHIKEVDGIRDLSKIAEFIQTMPLNDSKEFKKYVENKKPSLELNFEVKAPSGKMVHGRLGFNFNFFRPFFEV